MNTQTHFISPLVNRKVIKKDKHIQKRLNKDFRNSLIAEQEVLVNSVKMISAIGK